MTAQEIHDYTLEILEALARGFEGRGDALITGYGCAEALRGAAVDVVNEFERWRESGD